MNSPRKTVMARLSYRFGRLLKVMGCARFAAAAYRDAIASCPLWGEAHFERGDALIAARDWTGACAALAESVRLRPEHQEGRANLALALSKSGRASEALAELESLARLLPNDVHLHLLLGALYRRAQRQQDAFRAFRWAVRLPPPPATVRWHLGEAVLGSVDWEAVQQSYRGAAAVGPPPTGAVPPSWHSCLNQHPEQSPREFRRVAPRGDRNPEVPILYREMHLPRIGGAVAFVRDVLRGPGVLWRLTRGLVRRTRAPLHSFPARPASSSQWRPTPVAGPAGARRSVS
jgi:tetratricopeptide (TPR) repeat protein